MLSDDDVDDKLDEHAVDTRSAVVCTEQYSAESENPLNREERLKIFGIITYWFSSVCVKVRYSKIWNLGT